MEQKGQQAGQVGQTQNTLVTQRIMDLKMGQEVDPQTAEQLKKLETELTNSLADDIQDDQGKPYNFVGRIVDNGKIIIDPAKLLRIVELANKVNG